jgi:hypothetical protein
VWRNYSCGGITLVYSVERPLNEHKGNNFIMSETKSAQGSRIQQEIEDLRTKKLARNQRDKLKDSKLCS